MAGGNRGYFASFALDGFIYAAGGTIDFVIPINRFERYDPVSNVWTTLTNMTTARNGLSGAVLGNSLFAVGGLNLNGNYLSTVEKYEITTGNWSSVASLNTGRQNHDCVSL